MVSISKNKFDTSLTRIIVLLTIIFLFFVNLSALSAQTVTSLDLSKGCTDKYSFESVQSANSNSTLIVCVDITNNTNRRVFKYNFADGSTSLLNNYISQPEVVGINQAGLVSAVVSPFNQTRILQTEVQTVDQGLSILGNPNGTSKDVFYLDGSSYISLSGETHNSTISHELSFSSNFPNTTFSTNISAKYNVNPQETNFRLIPKLLPTGEFLFTLKSVFQAGRSSATNRYAYNCSGATGCLSIPFRRDKESTNDFTKINDKFHFAGCRLFPETIERGRSKYQRHLLFPSVSIKTGNRYSHQRLLLPFRSYSRHDAGEALAINSNGNIVGNYTHAGKESLFFWKRLNKKAINLNKIINQQPEFVATEGTEVTNTLDFQKLTDSGEVIVVVAKRTTTIANGNQVTEYFVSKISGLNS